MKKFVSIYAICAVLLIPFHCCAAEQDVDLKAIAKQIANGVKAQVLAEQLGVSKDEYNRYNSKGYDKRFSNIEVSRDSRGMVAKVPDKIQDDMLVEYIEFYPVDNAFSLDVLKKMFNGEWVMVPPNPDQFQAIQSTKYDEPQNKYIISIYANYSFDDKNAKSLKSILLRVDPRSNSKW